MPERSDLPVSNQDIVEPVTRASTWIPPAAGACRAEDIRLFLGVPGEPAVARLAREEEAKRVCARCAVLLECRAEALALPSPPAAHIRERSALAPFVDDAEPVGVRGGLTPEERRAIARRRRRRGSQRSSGR
ncbi:WhiB family transcriptional regulator [Yinghuangia seranimata]|uniref:WhiB family transcriptional regulator n=1 Tax=Yinghuangia seranimata TaxID=408067 RepID=UPI00248B3A02|nr:WhiB family transcriptional regulator [Yinghuangia seranimata]MDI2128874.1 WhiB family transcriptional regulator [Yinghuangia seranimata]